jgi:hypothetical protein
LIKVSGKPSEYLSTYREALETKAKRIAAQVTPAPARAPTNTGAGGGSASLEQQYKQELSKLRGNVRAITDLQIKYRKMGLNV